MPRQYIFTSKSVGAGHPDKLADAVSDAILDAVLAQDPRARVACETLIDEIALVLAGEITTTARVDYVEVARRTIVEVSYDHPSLGFDGNALAVLLALDRQSPDIAQGVEKGDGLDLEQGAGDQGMMFGYACRESPQLMPLPIQLAHNLTLRQDALRRDGTLPWLRPDMKCQVSVRYEDDRPVAVDTVVLSTQHAPEVDHATVQKAVSEHIIRPVLPGPRWSPPTSACWSTRPGASSSAGRPATAG